MATLTEQRRSSLAARAEAILKDIDRLLASPVGEREEEIDDQNLSIAKAHVSELKARLDSGRIPERPYRCAVMTRIIVDQWPWPTKLGDAISKLEADYEKL